MNQSRIITTLLILEIAFTGFLLFGTVSRAVSLGDLGIQRPRSLDVQVITEERGLDGTKYGECSGDIFTLFNGQLQQQVKQWAADTINMLLEEARSQIVQAGMCSLQNFLNNTFGIGTPCVRITLSDAKAELKAQLKNRLKSNFLVHCTTDMMRHAVTDTITAMIQTQGLDGGMAAATDWSHFASVRPAEIAQRQWWSMLVNTNICPWFRDEVLNNLGVPQSYRDQPPPISAQGYRIDERPPFQLRAGCTMPANFDISDTSPEAVKNNSGWQLLAAIEQPQNNPRDFITLALQEFEALKAERTQSARDQLIAGGGFTGTFGECAQDPNGKCIDDGAMKQVPGAVRDIVKSDIESAYLQINLANGEDGLLDDVAARIQARLLDLANAPLPFKIEFGAERNPKNFTPEPTPTLAPGETGPNDASCTGGDPRCTCVKDNEVAREVASKVIGSAVSTVLQNNSAFFVPGSNQIAPGVDFRLILQAICNQIGSEICHPHPNQDDEIVIDASGLSTSFDVITGDGFARTDGGAPVATCSEGVQ